MLFVARLVIAAPAALRHENLCIIRACKENQFQKLSAVGLSRQSSFSLQGALGFEDVGGFALRFMIGPDDQLRHQPEENELNPHDAEENGKEEQRVPVRFDCKEKILIKGSGA